MKKKTVIVIGDRNKNIRDFLKREFDAEGWEVVLAKDGREILARVQDPHPPDLVVMDLFVQVVDGFQVLETILHNHPGLPVIVYSSLVEYKNDPLVQAASAFVEKEAPLENLKAAIIAVLARPPAPGSLEGCSARA